MSSIVYVFDFGNGIRFTSFLLFSVIAFNLTIVVFKYISYNSIERGDYL
ncbi:hypothetical protein I2700191B6_19070 [Dorea formicigenerans]